MAAFGITLGADDGREARLVPDTQEGPRTGGLGVRFAGRVLGRAAGGQAHIKRIAAWVYETYDTDTVDESAAISAYLASPDRLADHASFLKGGLEGAGYLYLDATLDEAAEMVGQLHAGWSATAPRALRAALDDLILPPYEGSYPHA